MSFLFTFNLLFALFEDKHMGGLCAIDNFLKVLFKRLLTLDILCTHTNGVVCLGRRLELRIQKLDALQICHILCCLIRQKLGWHTHLISSTCGRLPSDILPASGSPWTRTCFSCTSILRSADFKLGPAWITLSCRRNAHLRWLYNTTMEIGVSSPKCWKSLARLIEVKKVRVVLTCWFH